MGGIILRRSKVAGKPLILVLIVLALLSSAQAQDFQRIKIEDVVINHGLSNEAGLGNKLTFDINVSSFDLAESTNATCGIDIYSSSGLVRELPNETRLVFPEEYNICISLAPLHT